MKVIEVTKADAESPTHKSSTGQYYFECPGCKDRHVIPTSAPTGNGAIWSFNGNIDQPTFTPSLMVRTGHFVSGHENDHCWCVYNNEQREKGENEAPFKCYVCHSSITDGKILFLSDCTHELAGQTVELPVIIK